MSEIDDGVIKFDQTDYVHSQGLNRKEFEQLESWRKKLYQLELIGEYQPEKIGYGNLSQRANYQHLRQTKKPQFMISGTQTGCLRELGPTHYTRVIDFDIQKNKVSVHGPIMASSESLTHAALYLISEHVKCVFHIHDKIIWRGMLEDKAPTTPQEIPYGTIEMAKCVQSMFPNQDHGYFAMAGHDEGVIAFASDLDKAGALILDLYKKYHRASSSSSCTEI